ncbi:hypothetical protein CTZ27_07780 [Streptomyces griseocarneus]|nr:hypothetical protein CTZ27_07780 [Streptomyces griseocarneus]
MWGWVFGARELDESECGAALYTDFEKDWSAQLAAVDGWAEAHGCARAGYDIWSIRQPSAYLAEFLRGRQISTVVVPSADIHARMRAAWADWPPITAELEAAGVTLAVADGDDMGEIAVAS